MKDFPLSYVTTELKQNETVTIPSEHFLFKTNSLPPLEVDSKTDGVYIPKNSNFPFIDLIWKTGVYLFGVQIHTGSTLDKARKAADFDSEFRKSSLFVNFKDNVFLIYLSPDEKTTMSMKKKYDSLKLTFDESGMKVGFITIAQVECLKDVLDIKVTKN